jgi:hypothetical protein
LGRDIEGLWSLAGLSPSNLRDSTLGASKIQGELINACFGVPSASSFFHHSICFCLASFSGGNPHMVAKISLKMKSREAEPKVEGQPNVIPVHLPLRQFMRIHNTMTQ